MKAALNSQKILAHLISKVQKMPSAIVSRDAFMPHLNVISEAYQGNHQNWNDGGFTNHH